MPRRLLIQFPGVMYHAMCRGDQHHKTLLDDLDRQDFLKTLAEAFQKG